MHVARGQHVECAFLCQFWWKGDSQSGRHKGIKAAAKLLRETTRQLSMQNWKTRSRRRGGGSWEVLWAIVVRLALQLLDWTFVQLKRYYCCIAQWMTDCQTDCQTARLMDWLTDRLTDWLRQRHNNITASGDSKSKLRFVKADPGWKKRFVSPVSGPVLIFW